MGSQTTGIGQSQEQGSKVGGGEDQRDGTGEGGREGEGEEKRIILPDTAQGISLCVNHGLLHYLRCTIIMSTCLLGCTKEGSHMHAHTYTGIPQ